MLTAEKLQADFLDYFNNYLTIAVYAEHRGLKEEEARILIDLGRSIHERIAAGDIAGDTF